MKRVILAGINIYLKPKIIKTCHWHRRRLTNQWNRVKSRKKDREPNLIYNKYSIYSQREEDELFSKLEKRRKEHCKGPQVREHAQSMSWSKNFPWLERRRQDDRERDDVKEGSRVFLFMSFWGVWTFYPSALFIPRLVTKLSYIFLCILLWLLLLHLDL